MMRQFLSGVAIAFSLAAPLSQAAAKPIVEVTFVLDTTGSMGPLIEGAKRKIWSIATAILDCSPDAEVRMGLVAYRDIGDDYVTKVFPLTTDIQDLYANLLSLSARGGGDWPESVNEALEVAVKRMPWTLGLNTSRIMFLVGDAPPHMDYAQDTKYPTVMAMARERGIVVNAVQAGDARDTARVWRDIAQMGNGEYIPIPQDGGHIVIIETPFDGPIIELQKGMNRTILPYGSRTERSRVEQKAAQVTAAPMASATDMAGYFARSNRGATTVEAITGDGDLVADVGSGRRKLADVKEEDLPEAIRKLPAAERQAYIQAKLAERNGINERLAALVKQRDTYLAAQQAKAPKRVDSFDRAVETTLKAQIK